VRLRGADRLKGVAKVAFNASFVLEPGEPVMTIGSCFARNIEARLQALGFDVPARGLSLPEDERASATENDFLNKYTPQSIVNELRWAFDPAHPFPDDAYLQVGELWHDPHINANVAPASLERVRERRAMVTDLYRRLPTFRVVVLTLGLVEVWLDTKTGLHLNGAPPIACLRREPDRFQVDVLSHAEILGALEAIHTLLRAHGHPDLKLLVTVSPVPMNRTFSGNDVLVANTYSKSTLRSAVGEFVCGRAGVDYFPSYEIATLTLRTTAFQEDNLHVAQGVVDVIVDGVAEAYCGVAPGAGSATEPMPAGNDEGADPGAGFEGLSLRQAAARCREAVRSDDVPQALKLFAFLDEKDRYKRAGYSEFLFRKGHAEMLVKAGSDLKALGQYELALAELPDSAILHFELGNVKHRLQRRREAEACYRRAVELSPEVPRYRKQMAQLMVANGAFEEAIVELNRVLTLVPDDPRSLALIADARSKLGASAPEAKPAAQRGLLQRLAKRLAG
jgi:tetratricopeptide (TPR) repeat protein